MREELNGHSRNWILKVSGCECRREMWNVG